MAPPGNFPAGRVTLGDTETPGVTALGLLLPKAGDAGRGLPGWPNPAPAADLDLALLLLEGEGGCPTPPDQV
jgi:hypothetical protein